MSQDCFFSFIKASHRFFKAMETGGLSLDDLLRKSGLSWDSFVPQSFLTQFLQTLWLQDLMSDGPESLDTLAKYSFKTIRSCL